MRPTFVLTPLAAALAASVLSIPVAAQSRVEPVLVTANRLAEPLADTLRDVTVITADMIARSGVADLVQLLTRVAGIQLSQPGPFATPSLFVRGHNSNQTLVLIDGQRIASSFNGLASLQNLGLEQIERIEIVRGPGSGAFGADAMGGVVNIITRRGDGGHRATVELHAGEHETFGLRASARGSFASTRLALSASHEKSEGYNAIVDPRAFSYNPDRDGWRVNRASLGLEHDVSSELSASARLMHSKSNSQYDGSKTRDDRALVELQTAQAGLHWHTSAITSEFTLGQGREEAEFISSFSGRYVTRNEQAVWSNRLRLAPGLDTRALLEWRRERIASSDRLPVTSRTTKSAVLGADFEAAPIRFSGNLRVDDSSQFGQRTTGGVGAGFRLSPQWRVSLNAGTAFKLPTFNDLYYPGFANPKLRPEASRNLEGTLAWREAGTSASITAYRSQVRDLIQFVCDANFNCAPQNIARAQLTGATLSLEHVWQNGVRLNASFDALDPKNRTNARQLPRRAKESGQLTLAAPLDVWLRGAELSAHLRAVGRRFDDAANRNVLPDYTVADLALRWNFRPGWSALLAVDNVTDRDWQSVRGYATGGRQWRLSLQGSF